MVSPLSARRAPGRAACAALLALACSLPLRAEPLSKKNDIDFFRDVPSRNLKGLAARSDGRLVAGPVLTELQGEPPADLLWCLIPGAAPSKWLVGTGPDGKIFEVTVDAKKATATSRKIAKLAEPHVFALARLPDGAILAGTSPHGALCLVRDGKEIARAALPVDSIFDLLLAPGQAGTALVATGNPARIYAVDLAAFAKAGVSPDKLTDAKALAAHGIRLFGEVRDRNIRRLARLPDGRVIAGSAPKGNVYAFAADGGQPDVLQENRDAEVTDLLPAANGDFYAAITFSGGTGDTRITPGSSGKSTGKDAGDLLFPASSPGSDDSKFGGRASLVWFPANGYPETLTSRSAMAFYRLGRHGDTLVLAGGEQGDLLGFDLSQKLSLTFAGSPSSQLNDLAAAPDAPGRFLVLHNNAPGFALLDFDATGPREAATRRIELTGPSQIGALRFDRVRDVADDQITLDLKTSNSSDEIEGWSGWTPLTAHDGGWRADHLRGRYVKLRLRLPANAASAQLDKAALFALPQNRRPQLQDFRLLSPNFGLVPAPDAPPQVTTTLGQLMQGGPKDDDKRKGGLLGSLVVPSPGAQVVFWSVVDPDGDNVACTYSIRRDGEDTWTDVAVDDRDSYVQFDTKQLPDGVYFTRLVAKETDPRPPADRLSATFETDDLVVDHTPPSILNAAVEKTADKLTVTVQGRDALSLLDGLEVVFNTGIHDQTEQPVDGIRDGREETFAMEFPLARVAAATSVEVTLYDAAGNSVSKRLSW